MEDITHMEIIKDFRRILPKYPLFRNSFLAENKQIRDTNIMTRVRKYIEEHCEWERIQVVLLDYRKRDVDKSHLPLLDATSYESRTRIPLM